MKLEITHFMKNQTLQGEEIDEIELSATDLETIYGGGSCPGSNGFPYPGNPSQNLGYNYGGNPYQSTGYNYGNLPGNGYGNTFNQTSPCPIPPSPPCPYSSPSY